MAIKAVNDHCHRRLRSVDIDLEHVQACVGIDGQGYLNGPCTHLSSLLLRPVSLLVKQPPRQPPMKMSTWLKKTSNDHGAGSLSRCRSSSPRRSPPRIRNLPRLHGRQMSSDRKPQWRRRATSRHNNGSAIYSTPRC
jgi:hypothetical protein